MTDERGALHPDAVLDPVVFSLTVFAILGTPGPTNTLLATSGALAGVRRSLPLIAAEAAGYLLAIGCLHLVLGPVIEANPAIRTALRLLIGAYLLHAAHELWTRRGGLGAAADGIRIQKVFVTTLLNPKAIVFALGVIPLTAPLAPLYVGAFVAFVAMVALSWIMIGAAIGHMASAGGSRLVPRISALVLMCFAGVIAIG
jgi:threonine/homoserine/homoserine lactone efflux protein